MIFPENKRVQKVNWEYVYVQTFRPFLSRETQIKSVKRPVFRIPFWNRKYVLNVNREYVAQT